MSAKEIKALIEVGTSLGYSGEELKQFKTIKDDLDAYFIRFERALYSF